MSDHIPESSEENFAIEPIYEVFYIQALIYAASRAKEAFERFDNAVQVATDPAEVVAPAHEALSHVAALSRFFWPARNNGIHRARAEKLRKAFGLDEKSPLSDRNLRNVLEHFDEHLDKFLKTPRVGYFFPSSIVGDASLSDDEIGHIFRLVDPRNQVFVLLGEKHSFGPLREVVNEVLHQAKLMDENGGRLSAQDI